VIGLPGRTHFHGRSQNLNRGNSCFEVSTSREAATPSEVLRNLNVARLAFQNRDASLCSVATAFERLTAGDASRYIDRLRSERLRPICTGSTRSLCNPRQLRR